MIKILSLVILTAFTAPEIIVDEDGFVTLIESPEERAREESDLARLEAVGQAFYQYHKNKEGDLAEVIALHEAILDSDMDIVEAVRGALLSRLAELRRERAEQTIGVSEADVTPERIEELKEQMQAGLFKDEELDVVMELLKDDAMRMGIPRKRPSIPERIARREKIIDNLPEEQLLEQAVQLFDLAQMLENATEKSSAKVIAPYYLRARQKALEAAQEEDPSQKVQALGIAYNSAKELQSLLTLEKDVGLCRELVAACADDKTLVKMIEALLRETAP